MTVNRRLAVAALSVFLAVGAGAQQPGFQILFGPTVGFSYALDEEFDTNVQAIRANSNVTYSNVMTSIGLDLQERIFLRSNYQFVFRQAITVFGMEQGVGLPYYQNTLGLQLPSGLEFGYGPRFSMAEVASVANSSRNNQYLSNTSIFYIVVPLNFGDFIVPLGITSTVQVPGSGVSYTGLFELNVGFSVPLIDINTDTHLAAPEEDE